MVKSIIFDLDDCLLDTWGATFPEAIRIALEEMKKKGLEVDSGSDDFRELVEINKTSKNSLQAIEKYLNKKNSYSTKLLQAGEQAIHGYTYPQGIVTLQGVDKMLESLSQKGIDLFIVSKGTKKNQKRKLKLAGIKESLFKLILFVDSYDKTKPYEKIISLLEHAPKEILVVGDRYETDLIPAKKLGMKTAWVPRGRGRLNPPLPGDVDYVIQNFDVFTKSILKLSRESYKVCVVVGGKGTRMAEFSKYYNKALLPLKGRPIICHIVEKFPEDIEIVFSVNYKKDELKTFLTYAYPKRKFVFVEDKFSPEGLKGPGYGLLQCKFHLQCPFVFVSGDTLVGEHIPRPSENWFGIAPVKETEKYCTVKMKNNLIYQMDDKMKTDNKYAFIGLAGVKDYETFFDSLTKDRTVVKGEIQVSNGFRALIGESLKGIIFNWFDTGDPKAYSYALENYPHGKGYSG